MAKLKKQAELAKQLTQSIEDAEKRIARRVVQRESFQKEFATKMQQLDEADKADQATIENTQQYLA